MLAEPENESGGAANGVAGVVVGKLHSFRGHLVEMGSLERLLATAADVTLAKVVHHHIDDVWFSGLGESEGREEEQGGKNASHESGVNIQQKVMQPGS